MTSQVVITACCAEDKEVFVAVNSENTGETYTLQDGESKEISVYDDREVTVKERVQETPPD